MDINQLIYQAEQKKGYNIFHRDFLVRLIISKNDQIRKLQEKLYAGKSSSSMRQGAAGFIIIDEVDDFESVTLERSVYIKQYLIKKAKMKNPIIELAELVQKQYGKSIKTRLVSKTGADHIPEIKVEIKLPDGRTFEASGKNKRLAKRKAAQIALNNFVNVGSCSDCHYSDNGKTSCFRLMPYAEPKIDNSKGVECVVGNKYVYYLKYKKPSSDEVKPKNYL